MKKILSFIIYAIVSFPKTLYFNLRCLPLKKALKLPVFVGYDVKIVGAKRKVISFGEGVKVKTFMIRFGFGGSRSVPPRARGRINVRSGTLTFLGTATFAKGTSLDCTGNMTIGDHFSTNKNCFISCSKEVTFGRDVMLGWDVTVFDAGGHTVRHNGEAKESQKPIYVGDHVWLCSSSSVLKGAVIGKDSIVAWGSVVTGRFPDEGLLIAGVPAVSKQNGMTWGPYIK